ncbi:MULTISPECIES: hypothetical protein [Roseomonadaceae]|uniref:Uncharacterized protein n=1 Tax=Falsiroseomonas oleicola TaxID=2801474 RepID=A0ABS6HE92_9PROT|nr:hypothetical protein [Roseomonas oleicola]MBU8547054.1 hypothetical protein [Roseomonas oleicola]
MEVGLQLSLKCLIPLPDGRCLLLGRASAPAAVGAELALMEGDTACPIAHGAFYPLPAQHGTEGSGAAPAHGFSLIADRVPKSPRLVLRAGGGSASAESVEHIFETAEAAGTSGLAKLLADQPPALGFALLRDAGTHAALASLMTLGGAPLGAFAEWMARLHPVRGRTVENLPGVEEAEALHSLGGDILVVVRGGAAFPPEARLELALVGLLPGAGPLASRAVALPLFDGHAAALPQALVLHGRIDPAWLDRLSALEVVLQLRMGAEEVHLLRCRPRAATVPDLLDAVCRTTLLAEAGEAGSTEALGLLRLLTARREAAFEPMLASLAAQCPQDADAGGQLPRIGLILGADDPVATRLLQVTAPEFEGRCDQLLILGDAAEEVAQAFLRRGRLPVLVGPAAVAALRQAGGVAAVLVVEAPRFAEAVARGRPAEAFSRPLGAADLARLLALHGAAGCEPGLEDSLVRLLRLERHRPGEAAFLPVPRGWSSPHAAELVNAHLARLWTAGLKTQGLRTEGLAAHV